jgi:predicted sulfurtransferase
MKSRQEVVSQSLSQTLTAGGAGYVGKSTIICVVDDDGRLFVGDVLITVDYQKRLDPDCRDALALNNNATRLHHCKECDSAFIGHHTARLCSDDCRKKSDARAFKKFRERKARQRHADWRRSE